MLGNTFTGDYENVAALSAALDRLQEKTGLDIPIHVDGASGAFVAPFIQPELRWDFQLPRVKSINTSEHKYGLVYPGVGWVIWREAADLHQDLIFNVDYLGGTRPTLALNFSRPASQIVAQYYNLIRLGKSGYRAIHQACQDVAVRLAGQIADLARSNSSAEAQTYRYSAGRGSRTLTGRCTIWRTACATAAGRCPPTACPPTGRTWSYSGLVVRNGFTCDLADMLVKDIRRHLDWFATQPGLRPKTEGPQFHH